MGWGSGNNLPHLTWKYFLARKVSIILWEGPILTVDDISCRKISLKISQFWRWNNYFFGEKWRHFCRRIRLDVGDCSWREIPLKFSFFAYFCYLVYDLHKLRFHFDMKTPVVGDANSFREKVQYLHISLFGFTKKVHLNHCGF